MLTATFARHGNYDREDLDKWGIIEAQNLGKVLSAQDFKDVSVYSSPVPRAQQTTQIAVESLGDLKIETTYNLTVDSSKEFQNLNATNIAQISARYGALFKQLPKNSNDLLFITHESNVIGFCIAFAGAVDNIYFKPQTGGVDLSF